SLPTRRSSDLKLFDQLEQIKRWYDEMLSEVLKKYPKLYVITQSYDYAIPVDSVAQPKKTSWLGKYMVEKGMKLQSDREALIRFMVDEFNDKLQEAIKPYEGRVFYVNVRGLTRSNQWFDEIHPTDEGFAAIADQFVSIIESVKKK